MSIHVALTHITHYKYDRLVTLGAQVVRLRPAPHCRTRILSYSLKIEPADHFINWQQDPFSNYQARLVFPEKTREFKVVVDLVAEMAVYNPFDFFLEPAAERYPFKYDELLNKELAPYLARGPLSSVFSKLLNSIDKTERRTIDFLVAVNQRIQHEVKYLIRMEPGVQTPEQTLTLGQGSCRDSGWLLVQLLRHMGLAARFVSGYLLQLTPDVKALDGPSGPEKDFTDLHAWCEVYLPGAGWVGLDPTSGLMAGEGHIPLACTPQPSSAAPVEGGVDECEVEFSHDMQVTRVYESPRVTKPYNDAQWSEILALGDAVDVELAANDVRLTMGGEPTFVSVADRDAAEWNIDALGPTKRGFATELVQKLRTEYGKGGFLHFGQGKWYPGEQLPRWALSICWRKDGQPVWQHPELFADERVPSSYTAADAKRFMHTLAFKLGVGLGTIKPGYEDTWYYLWRERRLPVNVDPFDARLSDELERARLRKIFDQGLDKVVGYVLPIKPSSEMTGEPTTYTAHGKRWQTGQWYVRDERMYLIPGDSPMGYRLPLDSIPWVDKKQYPYAIDADPFAPRNVLPSAAELRVQYAAPTQLPASQLGTGQTAVNYAGVAQPPKTVSLVAATSAQAAVAVPTSKTAIGTNTVVNNDTTSSQLPIKSAQNVSAFIKPSTPVLAPVPAPASPAPEDRYPKPFESAPWVTRSALCVETRKGVLYVFMPPLQFLEDYLALLSALEATALACGTKLVIEGYPPPRDPRLTTLAVTPDPGVIEVNIHPAHSWKQLVQQTEFLYQAAFEARLSTEKFMVDGRHTGTGGGNHFVLGGATPADSPFLRKPELLTSLVAYWHNHPSLSYLFSGLFIGPTSQAPRVDEARNDQLFELEIAMREIRANSERFGEEMPPWVVDRALRNVLVDVTGNTHRSEFCIDKLYSPDSSTGRLGLLELRAFEMPPHARMSVAQQLLMRALVSRFWKAPYTVPLTRWGTVLHDRFLLPSFVQLDFDDVIAELKEAGYAFDPAWFAPHFAFRFPLFGGVAVNSIEMSIRGALEPWHVMGEEGSSAGTVRYVDSSLERVEVKVTGLNESRYAITVNGRTLPLHNTGRAGEYVAGVRYRAWHPPSALHPTIGIHAPLTFDIVDTWVGRSLGGCQYHVTHPGGLSYDTFPVNSYEAESRRLSRFVRLGHTPGKMKVAPAQPSREFPFTLDLRR